MKKKVDFLDGALIAVTAGILFSLCFGFFLLPQKSFSEEENRSLSTWKRPTWQSVLDGSFSERLGKIYRDQFPQRSAWVAGKAYGELLLGKRENNRILFGEDGYLMARDEYDDLSVAEKNLQKVAEYTGATVVWIPRSADVMSDRLPSAYPDGAASELYRLLEGTGSIPMKLLQSAANEGREVYYRTDHHLTTEGAYLVYASLGNQLGYTPKEQSFFEQQTVSENFFGSADSAVGGIASRADTVTLFRYEGDEDFMVTDQTTGEQKEGFYDRSALGQKDQYEVFLGGNFAYLSVEDTEREKPRLLLIKDSFANALIPFLAIHFDLEIVDLRYCSDELKVKKCDRVLILQGVNTLATDPSLQKISLIKQKC